MCLFYVDWYYSREMLIFSGVSKIAQFSTLSNTRVKQKKVFSRGKNLTKK